jgi:AmiR/NasT family two-component response regulator
MQAQKGTADTLRAVVDAAAHIVPGARWAGISTIQGRRALASRDLIGQAKGILMHRENLTGLQAFNTLAHASKETNIKLVDVARWLVEEHENAVGQSQPPPTATK